ncbi:DUF2807 domain-containing protein [Aquimarina sp. ERC-38]|uniref:head GIN domain-containing protein n=1 Tax=Aquimarina sp. ERC-38 TaxID=2949996 RepID=UPI002247564E|nr:head GIN domain-containing protein [Aquimarina sp. ERC-38]UZO81830.1 DUF2807 domain-containing protein [Aquimarina sp. ERC-38]
MNTVKASTKLNILFFIYTLIITSASAQKAINREVDDFYEVKVFDRIEVILEQDIENGASITGSKKDEVVMVNNDGVLKIKMNLGHIWDPSNTKVKLYYKSIRVIDVNEGASITSNTIIEEDNLTIRAQEGGKVRAEIKTDKLDAKAVTGGELQLKGLAKIQKVSVQAGGQYLCKYLDTENTEVKISAGGFADVKASEFVKANTTAGGVIEIYGNPKEIERKKVFGGKIIEKK